MTVRAYILIECEAARSGAVSGGLGHLAVAYAKVLSADSVSGPFEFMTLTPVSVARRRRRGFE
jgi:hypothetical protein